jgi:polysaccharide biosynthesis/export protein
VLFRASIYISGLLFTCSCLQAEVRPVDASSKLPFSQVPPTVVSPAFTGDYVLGPGDKVSILETDLDEFGGRIFQINGAGQLSLPVVGNVRAAGVTISQLESELAKRARRYVNEPNFVVNVVDYHSQPITILGAVTSPGIHQIAGHKSLYEVLALAGGLRPDVGTSVFITRNIKWGSIPLPGAKLDSSGHFSVASVSIKSILSGSDPAQDIAICPDDVITVAHSDVVYAVGSVNRPGGFPIGQAENLSALQVVSLAQGLQRTAAPTKARILRATPNSSTRTEITVDLNKLMAGKGADVALQPNDILFVPNSGAKSATARGVDAIVTVATGLAVYGRF